MEKATQVASPEQLNGKDTEYPLEPTKDEVQLALTDLPVLPVRNTVVFPGVVVSLLVAREQSIRAIEEAMSKNRLLFAVTQLNEHLEDPGLDDLYIVGVEAYIERVIKLPDGTTNVLLRGQHRMKRIAYTQESPYARVSAEVITDTIESSLALEALRRAVLALFEKCVSVNPTLAEDVYITSINISEAGLMADFVVSTLELPIRVRQNVLEALSVEQRLQKVSILLSKELDIL